METVLYGCDDCNETSEIYTAFRATRDHLLCEKCLIKRKETCLHSFLDVTLSMKKEKCFDKPIKNYLRCSNCGTSFPCMLDIKAL